MQTGAEFGCNRAAQAGSMEAQMLLGTAYMSGILLPKDATLAAKYLLQAAQQQNVGQDLKISQALAQYFVATFYEQGRGVEQSTRESDSGSSSRPRPMAMIRRNSISGSLYNDGTGGLPKDKAQACQLFSEAADQGHVLAMHNAGYCYQVGVGVAKNLIKAVHYYTKASEAGNARSQHNLAMTYGALGQADKAYFWLRVAQSSGYSENLSLIDAAKGHLSAAEVAQQDQNILAWTSAHKVRQADPPTQHFGKFEP